MSSEPTRNPRKVYIYLGILLAEFLLVSLVCIGLSSTSWGQAILASDAVALPVFFMAKYGLPGIAVGGFLYVWLGVAGLFFAFTLLTSATLMFWIEPMFAKMVLPLLGGTPMVWNTCMVFYQAVLLAGYVYAHASTQFWGTRRQAKIHLLGLCTLGMAVVILVAVFFFPVRPGHTLGPRGGDNPVPWLLGFGLLTIGFPMFIISATAPMLQAWFAETGHKSAKDPYFLYAASNLGSMGALVAYPLLIEPNLSLGGQTWCWTAGFAVLMALTAGCAIWLWRSRAALVPAAAGDVDESFRGSSPVSERPARVESRDDWSRTEELANGPTLWLRLRWLALAFVPSSLLLGVTTYISTDVATFPLMWIIPLALYLLTFVIVFSRTTTLPYRLAKKAQSGMDRFFDAYLPRWLAGPLKAILGGPVELLDPHKVIVFLQPLVLAATLYTVAGGKSLAHIVGWNLPSYLEMTIISLAAFFVTAMVCHGELARSRPASRHLTEFYIWMSVGGVLGGMFNALVAPKVFNTVVEYPLVIAVACALRPQIGTYRFPVFSRWMDLLLPAAMFTVLTALVTADHCHHKEHQRSMTQPADSWHKDVGHELPTGHWIRPTNEWLNEVLPMSEANDALVRRFGPAPLEVAESDSEEEKQDKLSEWNSDVQRCRLLPETWNLDEKTTILVLGCVVVFLFQFRPLRFGLGVGLLFLIYFHWYGPTHEEPAPVENGVRRTDRVIYQTRSFYGVIRVKEEKEVRVSVDENGVEKEGEVLRLIHTILHGTTDHGQQRFDHGWREEPISYYFRKSKLSEARNSPLGDVFQRLIDPNVHHEIGVCGLGTGTTAAYAQRGQRITYFEIDPAVLDIDTEARFKIPGTGEEVPLFTFLLDAKNRGARVEVKLGDARLTLQTEEDGKFDLLVVDAFSSDAIPVHLLTKEAVELYFQKLKPSGVLMVHISNRHLELAPVVGNIAKELNLTALRFDDEDESADKARSEWIALARDEKRLAKLSEQDSDADWQEIPEYEKTVLWTDDFSNIVEVLDWWRIMGMDHPATTPKARNGQAAR